MKRLLASLLLSSTLLSAACASTAAAAPSKPAPGMREMPMVVDRATVKAKLAERRKIMIERFLAYREARVYPWNFGTTLQPKHMWFDNSGNLCAAATLISYDWGRASTMKVGEKNRGIVLAKVTRGELADWMLTSGLTHHEIVAIQVPPMGVDEIMRPREIERLYAMYTDVERQLKTLGDENLDLATDALMKRPDLAFQLIHGRLPGPGKFKVIEPAPEPAPDMPVQPPTEPEPAPAVEPAA